MNDFMEDLLRFLTRNPNLGLLVSALLTRRCLKTLIGRIEASR